MEVEPEFEPEVALALDAALESVAGAETVAGAGAGAGAVAAASVFGAEACGVTAGSAVFWACAWAGCGIGLGPSPGLYWLYSPGVRAGHPTPKQGPEMCSNEQPVSCAVHATTMSIPLYRFRIVPSHRFEYRGKSTRILNTSWHGSSGRQ